MARRKKQSPPPAEMTPEQREAFDKANPKATLFAVIFGLILCVLHVPMIACIFMALLVWLLWIAIKMAIAQLPWHKNKKTSEPTDTPSNFWRPETTTDAQKAQDVPGVKAVPMAPAVEPAPPVPVAPAPDDLAALHALLKDYVVVDTETTGLDREYDEMIEIAIVTVHDGVVTDEYSTFIKPTVPVSAGARSVNGITDDDLADAPYIWDACPEIARRLQNQKIVGHNVRFDLAFIARALAGTEGLDTLHYIDTLTISRRCLNYNSYKLQDLAESLQLDAGTGHRALDDARTTNQLLQYCIKKMVDDDTKRKQEAAEKRRLAKEKRAAAFAWSPLFDKNFVFTGDFLTDREKLQDLLKSVGANLRTEVNSRTVYLVVGDLSHLPDWALARKSGAADARIAKGQPITKLTEAEYINLIQQTLALKK